MVLVLLLSHKLGLAPLFLQELLILMVTYNFFRNNSPSGLLKHGVGLYVDSSSKVGHVGIF